MNQNESVELFLEGREAWNAWAERMLAERRAMEESGRWTAERDLAGNLQAQNQETTIWMREVQVDFSGKQFGIDSELPPHCSHVPTSNSTIDFNGFIFPGNVQFNNCIFHGYASFISCKFLGDVSFEGALFEEKLQLELSRFSGRVTFNRGIFRGQAFLREVEFQRRALFEACTFKDETSFFDATFRRTTRFNKTNFKDVSFRHSKFLSRVEFAETYFAGWCLFESATFSGYANFRNALFGGYPNFIAVRCERAFDLGGVVFQGVPDFTQAHFEEAPQLDAVIVKGRFIKENLNKNLPSEGKQPVVRWPHNANYQIPSRWRSLKRLAIQGHDTDRELEFHAREVRSARFAGDWPLPLAFWRGRAWTSAFRFWFGILYQTASDFGRSVARPLVLWLLAVVTGAAIYLSQSPVMIEARHHQEAKGASAVSAAASRAWQAWLSKRLPCYAGQPKPEDKDAVYVGALSPALQSGTDLANEAWHLAFRNAFIVLDGSSEAAHRTYGCLYGVELYGGSNPLAVVPSAVSTASAVQKLFSALMIFLFGLALRNMLKMK